MPKTMNNIENGKSDKEIKRKLGDFRSLTNRLNRYWKFLAKESLRKAKEQGLETYVTQSKIYPLYDIVIRRKGDEITDDTELLELTRQQYPSLLRRYSEGLKRHQKLKSELEEIYESL